MRSTLGAANPTRETKDTPVEQHTQDADIDLHRRRIVIVRRDQGDGTLDTVRIDNEQIW